MRCRDRSSQCRFVAGLNLLTLRKTANAESYSTDLRLAATAASTSGGTVTYPAVGSPGDLALTDTVVNTAITDFSAAMTYAQQRI